LTEKGPSFGNAEEQI
jgi:hypothetical protein